MNRPAEGLELCSMYSSGWWSCCYWRMEAMFQFRVADRKLVFVPHVEVPL